MVLKYCYELQDPDILLFMASTFISKRLSDSFKKKERKKGVNNRACLGNHLEMLTCMTSAPFFFPERAGELCISVIRGRPQLHIHLARVTIIVVDHAP